MLQRNPDGLLLIDPVVGSPLTESVPWASQGPLALLSCNGCVAITQGNGEVAMVGWALNQGRLDKVFRIPIGDPAMQGYAARAATLGVSGQLAPLETSGGLLIALSEAGSGIRIWHETRAFQNAGIDA
jgi:hypothetical protein